MNARQFSEDCLERKDDEELNWPPHLTCCRICGGLTLHIGGTTFTFFCDDWMQMFNVPNFYDFCVYLYIRNV